MNLQEQYLNLIDQQKWLDQVADPLQTAVRNAFQSTGKTGEEVMDFLHGTWLGHPLHSVLTDLPIGSYTAAEALDGLEVATGNEDFGVGADIAVLLGITGAITSAVTGVTDWQHTSGHHRRIGMAHALLNTTSLGFYLASLAFRKQRKREAGRALGVLGYLAMTAAAYLGGHLVYNSKIGVDHAPQMDLPEKFTPAMALSDLPEDQLHRIEVNCIPILLVRRGDRVFAIAETCSHLGGPLSEGQLMDDNTVICPWHASRFSIEDGSLVNGPSTYDQPCFETRIRDGQIEVRYAGS